MATVPSFKEDFFERVVNVTWTGKIVVIMGQEIADVEGTFGKRYVGKPAKQGDKPQEWNLVSSNKTAFRSQTYALVKDENNPDAKGVPTFLMGSGWTDTAEIYYSNNGEDWSAVHSESVENGYGFTGLVWNSTDKKFYAAFYGISNGSEVYFEAQIFSSSDGKSWSGGEKFTAATSAETDAQYNAASTAFRAHCKKPENKGGIPDGLQAFDSKNKIFMKPEGLTGWNISGPIIDPKGITIEGGVGGGSGPTNVWAVSFAEGVWNALTYDASGSGFQRKTEVHFSKDAGKSWESTFLTTGWFPAGISGGMVKKTS